MNPAGNPSVRDVRAIRVLPETLAVDDGDSARLVATVFDQVGVVFSPLPSTARLAWTSSLPGIAAVDSAGLVRGVRPGAAQVTAAVQGADIPLSLSTQVVVRAVPTALAAVSGDSQTAAVGTRLPQDLLVKVTDRHGDGVPGVMVTFAVSAGRGTLGADSAVTDATGMGSAALTLDTLVGFSVVQARAARLPQALVQFHAQGRPGAVTKLNVLSGDAQGALTGAPLPSPLVVRATDRYNNAVPGVTVSWQVTAGGGSVLPASSVTDSLGQAQTVWTMGGAPGAQSVRAAAGGALAAAFAASARSRVARVTVSPGSASVSLDSTRTFAATPRDSAGTALAGRAVTWTSSDTLKATIDSAGVLTARGLGAVTVTAAIEGVGGTATVTVTPGAISPATSLVSVSSATVASGLAVTLAVHGRDAHGNPVAIGGRTVVFTASGGTSTGTIGATADSGNGVYAASFTGVHAGTATAIGATIDGVAVTTPAPTVTVIPGGATQLTFTTQPAGAAAGTGFGAVVTAFDAQGNVATGYAGTVAVALTAGAGPAGAHLLGTTGVAAVAGVATFSGLSLDSAGAGYTLTAGATGLASAASAPFTVSAGAVSLSRSAAMAARVSVASGDTVTVALRARDSFGNALTSGGLAVSFTVSGGTSSGTFGPVADHGDGSYAALFTGVTAGTPATIGARIGGGAVTSPLPALTVTPGPAAPIQSAVTVARASVASGDTVTVSLRSRDAQGNALTTGGLTVAFSVSGGTSTGTFGATTDHADGTYTALFTGVLAGTATAVHATITGVAVTTTAPTVTVIPGDASQLTFTTQPAGAAAGVGFGAAVTAFDAQGNAATAFAGTVAVALTAGAGPAGAHLLGTTGVAAVAGVATFSGISLDSAGAGYTLTASATGLASAVSAAFAVGAGAASLARSLVTVARGTVASGDTVTAALRARDSFGNALTSGGLTVAFAASGGTSTGTFGAVTDHGDGTYSATFTGAVAGTATTIGATIGGGAVTSPLPALTVTPGPAAPSHAVVTVARATVASGDTVTVALRARDAQGNALTSGGLTVAFSVSGGTSTGTFGSTTDHADGTYTALFTGVLAGTADTIHATIAAVAVTGTLPTLSVTAGAASAAQSVVTVSQGSVVVGQNVQLRLRARDAAGKALSAGGLTVVFSASGGTSQGTIAGTVDAGDGTYSASFTGTVAGTVLTVSATINGAPVTSSLPTVRVLAPLVVASVPLSAGVAHACEIRSGGAVWCWGGNAAGQLGDGTTTDAVMPVQVATAQSFVAVSAGDDHTCALTSAGSAWCWGGNAVGQLGDGTINPSLSPVAVTGGLQFVQLIAGGGFTCGRVATGEAYCWGGNGNGQLGDGTNAPHGAPAIVTGGLTFASLALFGNNHACGLTTVGAAYCWGYNFDGELGNGANADSWVPSAVSGGLTFAAITAGTFHSCGLTAGGVTYCWGDNNVAQLGYGAVPTDSWTPGVVQGGASFTTIIAGGGHTCGIVSGGSLQCWGYNQEGALGDGTRTTRLAPAPVSGGLSFVRVAGGGDFTCGQTTTGETWCWGINTVGQMADATHIERLVPVQSGVSQAVATVDATPGSTALAIGATQTLTATTRIANGSAVTGRVVTWASSDSTVASVAANGLVMAFGTGTATITATSEGVSGEATVTVTASGPSATATALVSTGYVHTCAIRAGLHPWCWGFGGSGYLNGVAFYSVYNQPHPVVTTLQFTQISAGYEATCGLTVDSLPYCWGRGGYGELGNGSPYIQSYPGAVSGGLKFVQIRLGWGIACGLTAAGTVYCWGLDEFNIAGYSSTYFGYNTVQPTPKQVAMPEPITTLGDFGNHACALGVSRTVYCWGLNDAGSTGTAPMYPPGAVAGAPASIGLAVGEYMTCSLGTAGDAWCWGYNNLYALGRTTPTVENPTPGLVDGGLTFAAIYAGNGFGCGLQSSGAAYCWGANNRGQLGTGDTVTAPAPVPVSGGLTFIALTLGESHACGLTPTGQLYCWGRNSEGQLGDVTYTDRLTPTLIP